MKFDDKACETCGGTEFWRISERRHCVTCDPKLEWCPICGLYPPSWYIENEWYCQRCYAKKEYYDKGWTWDPLNHVLIPPERKKSLLRRLLNRD